MLHTFFYYVNIVLHQSTFQWNGQTTAKNIITNIGLFIYFTIYVIPAMAVNFDRFKHNTEFYFLLSTKLNNEITWLVAIVPDHHYGKLNWALYFCMRYDIRVNILMGINVKITGEIPCVQTCIMKAFHYAIIVSNLNL